MGDKKTLDLIKKISDITNLSIAEIFSKIGVPKNLSEFQI